MGDYAPQMALDSARFLWIPDVLQRNFSILVVWMVLSFLANLINPATQPGHVASCYWAVRCSWWWPGC